MSTKELPSKLRKGRIIESNWDCPMPEVVPANIRPRENKSPKSKAPVGSSSPELHWHHWSYELIHHLEKLSYRTAGKLAFAQELMILEVRQRQEDLKNHMRAAAEILLQDLQRIVRDLTENPSNCGNEYFSDGGEPSDDEDGDDVEDLQNDHERPDSVEVIDEQQEVKTEDGKANLSNGVTVEGSRKTIIKYEDSPAKARNKSSSQKVLKSKAKILRLRADAMRLKQEAAKRLAEAFELEANMLMTEEA